MDKSTGKLCFCRKCLPYAIPSLLLREHDTETLEVVQFSALIDGRNLLCPGRALPLLYDFLRFNTLLNCSGTCSTGEAGYDERSKREVTVREGLAGNGGGRSINNGLKRYSR